MAKKRKPGDKLSQEQQTGLHSDAHAYLRFARNAYLEIKGSEKTFELSALKNLSGMRVVWTNTGFALELMLKWILYCDHEKVLPVHYSGSHKLHPIYKALSPKAREAVEKIHSGEMSYAATTGEGELTAIKGTNNPHEPPPELPKSYKAPLNTARDMLKFIDANKLLYDMRYSSVSHDGAELKMFMTGLDHLFAFINNLARLVKFKNGNWGWQNGIWIGHGIQRSRLTPEEIQKFYEERGWGTDGLGRWTKMAPNGRIVVYHPEAYVNAFTDSSEHPVAKEKPYLHGSARSSREGSYSEPYLVAELIACDD